MVRRESHVNVDPNKLLHELRRRGHSAASFAKVAGISAGTLSAIIQHGKPCTPRTARKIGTALWQTQAVQGLADILAED
jgi:lambda repressor-like predicted transcriptional regulator